MMISLIDVLLGVVAPQTTAQPASAQPETLPEAFATLLRLLQQNASSTPATPIDVAQTMAAAAEPSTDNSPDTSGEEPPVDVEAPPEHGPPVHRAMPAVVLPAAALAHALHSNGAPFEAYRVANATPPPQAETPIAPPSAPAILGEAKAAVAAAAPPPPQTAEGAARPRAPDATPLPAAPTDSVKPTSPGNGPMHTAPPEADGANRQPKVLPNAAPMEPPLSKVTTSKEHLPEVSLPALPAVRKLTAVTRAMGTVPVPAEPESPMLVAPVRVAEARRSPPPADDAFLPAAATLHRAVRAMQVLAAIEPGAVPPETPKQGAVQTLDGALKAKPRSENVLPAAKAAVEAAIGEGDVSLRPTEVGPALRRVQRGAEPPLTTLKPSAPNEAMPPSGNTSSETTPTTTSVETAPSSSLTRPGAMQTTAPVEATPSAGQWRAEAAPTAAHVEAAAPASTTRTEAMPTAVPGSDQGRTPEVASPRGAVFAEVPDRPVNPVEHAAQSAIQHVRRLVFSGEQTLSVRLVPNSLGELHITVTTTRDVVEVVLASSNPQVRQALEQHLHTLRDALARDGLELTRTTVTTPVNTESDVQTAFARAGSSGQQSAPGRHGPGQSFAGYPHAREPDVPNPHRRSWTPSDGRLNVLV